MAFCKKCGNILSENTKFCKVCGFSVSETSNSNKIHLKKEESVQSKPISLRKDTPNSNSNFNANPNPNASNYTGYTSYNPTPTTPAYNNQYNANNAYTTPPQHNPVNPRKQANYDNKLSIIGMVLSLLSITSCCFGGSLLFSVVGIILCIVGMQQNKKEGKPNSSTPIIGIVLGAVGILFFIICQIIKNIFIQ